jgi:hypothetical protein
MRIQMRTPLILLLSVVLSSCGAEDEDIACCAIAPKAKCESALYGMGVARAEAAELMRGAACPSETLGEDRIRELDGNWPEECRVAGFASPAMRMDLCPPASEAATVPGHDASPQ